MFIRFSNLICMVAAVCLPSLWAQPPNENNTVNTRIVLLGMKGDIRGLGIWNREGKFEELWIPSSYFPEPVKYRGPNPLTLVTMVKNEEEEEIPVPVASVSLPADQEEVLLLLVPRTPTEKKEKTENQPPLVEPPVQYKIMVLNFSPRAFPDTSFMLWNLTGRPIVGTLGGEKPFRAADRQFVLLQPHIEGPKALDAKILYADDPSRESYTSRKWFLNPGQKDMIMIFPDPDNRNAYLLKSIRYTSSENGE